MENGAENSVSITVSLSPVIWYAGFRQTCGYALMMRIKNVDEGALILASALMQASLMIQSRSQLEIP